jgi:hypothetical protein
VSRRTSLPGADELFRSTGSGAAAAQAAAPARLTPVADPVETGDDAGATGADAHGVAVSPVRTRSTGSRRSSRVAADRRPTGREKHEEKITVYVSPDELLDLEHARLNLRGDHGLAVDRGRLVREALAVVLADFEAKGETSILVRRLRGR